MSYRLDDRTVLLWDFPCETRPPPEDEALLSADERERASRFHFDRDRNVYVTVRGRLRRILGGLLGRRPSDLTFAYGRQGKPSLPDDALEFNVSHAGGRGMIAVARDRRLGVDLEPTEEAAGARRRSPGFEVELARRFFSPHEREELARLPAEARRAAFYRGWTRKEAFIKADGRGIAIGLDAFAVSLEEGKAELLWTAWDPEEARRWTLRPLRAAPGFEAALAVEGAGWRLVRP